LMYRRKTGRRRRFLQAFIQHSTTTDCLSKQHDPLQWLLLRERQRWFFLRPNRRPTRHHSSNRSYATPPRSHSPKESIDGERNSCCLSRTYKRPQTTVHSEIAL
jgi:hypothetical protein